MLSQCVFRLVLQKPAGSSRLQKPASSSRLQKPAGSSRLQKPASSSRHSDLRHRRPMASAAPDVPADMELTTERLLSSLQTCVTDDGDISMDMYVAVVENLYKILKRVGEDSLEFLLDEMKVNLSLLKDYREGHSREHYATVQGMIDHELRNDLIHSDSRPSGTHTVLGFHRTLEFIHISVGKIQDSTISNEEFPGEIVRAYMETLGRFHPELIVASIQWALPTFIMSRVSIIETLGFAKDHSKFWSFVSLAVDNLKRLNDAVHTVYERHQILKLPEDDEESKTCS